jgi:hypothetical protein
VAGTATAAAAVVMVLSTARIPDAVAAPGTAAPRRRLWDGLHLPLGVLVHRTGVRPNVGGCRWRVRQRGECPLGGRHDEL